ncbi:uncharacterized protein si:ch211-40k21.5 isoform X1 [Pimephales promelas]|uniref:uncharacterized protein si:ch211-40k21.5 isoform X1 n=1 Tax=Pimephales promelas TaxID=90988 RepID=UPI001955AB52|nr:uncharacterized protein si:ch211-40k21.5 isoform X1 [Pimephales promelas]
MENASQAPVKSKRRRYSAEEVRERKKAVDRASDSTRINIGRAFTEWRELRDIEYCKTDADLAFLLMQVYKRWQATTSTLHKGQSRPPQLVVSKIGEESDRDMVCGEHLPQVQPSAAPRKRGRPRKSTFEPKTEPSPDPSSTDHSQSSSDRQSDSESQPSPDPQPTNVEVLGKCHDLPSLWPNKPDKQAQPERQNYGSDLDVVIGSIEPSYGFARHSSSSSTTTEEDNAMNWEEIKDELAQTTQRLEQRLNVMRSLTDGALEPISMTKGNDQKEVKWVVNKSSLTGLFRTCHQCGDPVLEFKTLTSGSLIRIQWECSKGHLMWLFPNNPT